jgi:hypothetical protein
MKLAVTAGVLFFEGRRPARASRGAMRTRRFD